VVGEKSLSGGLTTLDDALAQIDALRERLLHARADRLKLRMEARTDDLTGAATRSFFLEQLDLVFASDPTPCPAVIMLDIDHFKAINDVHGHHVGDEVLRAIVTQLRRVVGDGGIVSRFGGDEFAVLLYDEADVPAALTRISDACQRPIPTDTTAVTPSLTMGAAIWDGSSDEHAMLRYADFAMYQARRSQEQAVIFDWNTKQQLALERAISDDLLGAIDNDLIQLAFQPIVSLDSGHVSALEVLSRWSHPVYGNVGPAVFVGVAERRHLISQLDRRIVERSLHWFGRTPAIPPTVDLSINVSPLTLGQGFASYVDSMIRTHAVDPTRVTLEVTETASVRDLKTAHSTLCEVSEIGVQVSLDDFGTGYSSLTYVHDLPISELKIDRSFVDRMIEERKARELVRAIIHVAKALDLRLVAEGIETPEHSALLRNMGCERGQGYYFSRPVDEACAIELLTQPLPRGSREVSTSWPLAIGETN